MAKEDERQIDLPVTFVDLKDGEEAPRFATLATQPLQSPFRVVL